jgi:1,4-alpha-glucan branching enzyme
MAGRKRSENRSKKEVQKKSGTGAKKQTASQLNMSQMNADTEEAAIEKINSLSVESKLKKVKFSHTNSSAHTEKEQNSTQVLEQNFLTRISDFDVYLFREGRHYSLYEKLGSHTMERNGEKGVYFAVWAPNAAEVFVMGDFNGWNKESHPLYVRYDSSGIWENFIPGLSEGTVYKYYITSKYNNYAVEKADPYAFMCEVPPHTASVVVANLDFEWTDMRWMKDRRQKNFLEEPCAVYEVHLGSWRRKPEQENRSLSYRELAAELPLYVKELGFTHVELMPVMEHPFYGSWGYQITGYFAPSSRYGSPQDFMLLINALHEAGIGVILDWVPSHFPGDEHGLSYFDGTHLYEHADMRKGFHPDWRSYIFNYGRDEVKSFLISNACFWLDKYHIDGLRVDAVASMLYLDYSRKEGEWIPNEFGGRENLEAIRILKELNEVTYSRFPDVITIAEESTAWPMVSKPTYIGGLGFAMKWMMGWMHDTLHYFQKDPVYRKFHQNEITFSIYYAFTENFMLPLSHDEVVYGKGSLLNKMPGDYWQKFANLRLLFAYMYAHPGTKLIFMGGDIAQWNEWNHDSSLDWHLLQNEQHIGVNKLLAHLNKLYKEEPALHKNNFNEKGFEWVDISDTENCVISFLRKDNEDNYILAVINFTPVVRGNYHVGVPEGGFWREILNSDSIIFGGSNVSNLPGCEAEERSVHGRNYSLSLNLPPLAVMYFKKER